MRIIQFMTLFINVLNSRANGQWNNKNKNNNNNNEIIIVITTTDCYKVI
jgi:hypothetical protein